MQRFTKYILVEIKLLFKTFWYISNKNTMRSVEFQVTPSHFKSSPTSFRLPIFLYLLSNEFMEIGFWELKWQFLYLEIHSKSCDEKFLVVENKSS